MLETVAESSEGGHRTWVNARSRRGGAGGVCLKTLTWGLPRSWLGKVCVCPRAPWTSPGFELGMVVAFVALKIVVV